MVETKGIIEKGNKCYCEKCNADLSVPNSVKSAVFIDMADGYIQDYRCIKCGNIITIYEKHAVDKEEYKE